MLRIFRGIILGIILGVILYYLGNYGIKLFLPAKSTIENSKVNQATIEDVKTYAPAALQIKVKDVKTITVNWKTLKPVDSYIVLLKEDLPFVGIKDMIVSGQIDTAVALIIKVDDQKDYHSIDISTELFKSKPYFYLIHVINSGVAIPYGKKVNNTSGAIQPWYLDIDRLNR